MFPEAVWTVRETQPRRRVIIVGFRKDFNASWSFPAATHSQEAPFHSKWVTGEYWEEHAMKRLAETPLSAQQLRTIRRIAEDTDTPMLRWQTVCDAIGDFLSYEVLAYVCRNDRYACPIYAGKAVPDGAMCIYSRGIGSACA